MQTDEDKNDMKKKKDDMKLRDDECDFVLLLL